MKQLKKIGLYYPHFVTLLVLWTLLPELPILSTLKTTSGALTKHSRLIPTTLSAGMRLTTPLHHATLRINRFSSKTLAIVSHIFFGADALENDGEGPFCFCWNDDW